jgi:hypothetical protein
MRKLVRRRFDPVDSGRARMTWRGLAAVATAALFLAPAAAVAAPASQLTLDSYAKGSAGHTREATTSFTVASGKYDVAVVSGTFSYWGSRYYATNPKKGTKIMCGSPESAPQYSGSAGGTGKVGLDAEFIFARLWNRGQCSAITLPQHWSNFQMYTGSGPWAHPKLLGSLSQPTANHTYSYAVKGAGTKVSFRLTDLYTSDNYGVLKITLRPAVASDCTSYSAFGFTSQAACVSAVS